MVLRDSTISHFLYQHMRRLSTYAQVWQMSQTFVKEWGMHVERRLRMRFLIYWSQVLPPPPALSNRPCSLVSDGPSLIKIFFLNNQPDAPVIQIYSVIKHYMFRASSLCPSSGVFYCTFGTGKFHAGFWWPLPSRVRMELQFHPDSDSNKNKGYFTWRPLHIYGHISLSS